MIYVYRRASSTGARSLVEQLNGIRSRNAERLQRRVRTGDAVIMWGEHLPLPAGVKVLNNIALQNKFEDAVRLKAAGVSTIEVSRTRPVYVPPTPPADPLNDLWDDAVELADAFAGTTPSRSEVAREGLQELLDSLLKVQQNQLIAAPTATPREAEGWLAREFNHTGGTDLLRPSGRADFYAKKEEFVHEYRVHSFLGKSLRAGRKELREGFILPNTPGQGNAQVAHAWVKSWDGGWRIVYAGVAVRQRHRDIAHAAVKALGLDFGAVDIGERADGTLVVLEVNRAAGLEGGTVEAYANAVQAWINAPATGAPAGR